MLESPSRWVRRALRHVSSPTRTPRRSSSTHNATHSRPRSRNVGFVEDTADLWIDFCKNPDMQTLLEAHGGSSHESPVARTLFRDETDAGADDDHHHDKAAIDWSTHLATACRLFRDLEHDAMTNSTALFVPTYMDVFLCLIKVTYYQQNAMVDCVFQEDPRLYVLHAAVGLSSTQGTQWMVPHVILRMILTVYTHQLRQRDPVHCKYLPLTMACANGHWLLLPMLVAYPPAASIPCHDYHSGEYPLHIACRSGHWDWATGIRDLWEAAPAALACMSHVDGSPFVGAALAQASAPTNPNDDNENDKNKDDLASLETLFELLRRDPAVLVQYVVGE